MAPAAAGRGLEGLRAPARPVAPGSLIGIEHEYIVRRAEAVVDFQELIHRLPVPGRRLDPGDVNAYRLPCGLALTCDEGEAEVATPPIAVQPGFGAEVEAWARHGRSQLEGILPPAHKLEGYSTHLSAAMPGNDGDDVARLYTRTFAPALALLLERPESHGLYVRPRPGRLELCGEFVEGPRLGAVAAFVAGTSRATALAAAGRGRLPPALAVRTLPAVERYGLRVTRQACGLDLYAEGRSALLPLANGGEIPAQQYLEAAWGAGREALVGSASPEDVAVLDRMVGGARPLGVEIRDPEAPSPLPVAAPSSALGQVTRRWRRPGFSLEAVVATWDFTVFRVEGGQASALVCIPRESLAGFVANLDSGRLDGALRAALESSSGRPQLSRNEQTERVGVFSSMSDPVALLPAERDPDYGQAKSERGARPGKAGGIPSGRPGKSPSRPWKFLIPMRPQSAAPLLPSGPEAGGSGETAFAPPPAPPPPVPGSSASSGGGGLPWLLVAAIGAMAVAGSVIAGALVVNSGGTDPPGTPTVGAPHTETAAPTRPPISTPTAPTATATATPRNDAAVASPSATSTPSLTATKTAGAAVATSTPVATATPKATETPAPTATPTRFATETPKPTFTPTATATPTGTATPRPAATPTPLPILLPAPTTVKSTCTPGPAATCPP